MNHCSNETLSINDLQNSPKNLQRETFEHFLNLTASTFNYFVLYYEFIYNYEHTPIK